MKIAVALFDRVTALDPVGPYEMLQRVPDLDVVFVGHEVGEIRSENGMLGLLVDATVDQVPFPDVLLMPGGVGTRSLLTDERVLDWVRTAHRTTLLTTSVCTGSLVLAAAGLLEGLPATTHWSVYDVLEKLGARVEQERVVPLWNERIVTSAGVSSGIDMALTIISHLVDDTAAMAAQLLTEYDPQPPFDSGSVAKATPEVKQRAREYALLRS
jgi:putative intracellular protease/amidase